MIPVAQIKKDLSYSRDLTDTIDVLKLMATSEFGNLSSRKPKRDMLKERIIECFGLLRAISETNPFFIEQKGIPKGYLMICSDEGFLGEVNALVVGAAMKRGLEEKAKFAVLGEKGKKILSETGVEFDSFPGIENDIDMKEIIKISDYIMDLYKKKKISAMYVSYMKFGSFTSHHLDVAKLLPCGELIDYIKETGKKDSETLIEPNPYYVLEYLVKLWIECNMHDIFWSSKLSEWSVRAMHLEQSSDELKKVNRDLRFKYFKSVHALNDKVIREIFAARASL